MYLLFHIPLVALLLQDPVAKDSAGAVWLAAQLARSQYERTETRIGLDTLHKLYPRFRDWEFPPMRPGNCISESLEECLGGDWDCQGWLDCSDPRQAARLAWVLDELDRLAPIAAGSDHVFRQRVAFAVKNGDLKRAASVAESCFSAEEWWCMSLRGFVANWVKPGSGLAAFDSALARAPRTLACEWSDYARLRPSAALALRRGDNCALGDPGVDRFWWMADPLWTSPGNERRAAHLARLVIVEMTRDMWMQGAQLCRSEVLRKGPPNSVRILRRPAPNSTYETAALWYGRCLLADSDPGILSDEEVRFFDAMKRPPTPPGVPTPPLAKRPVRTWHERFVHGGYSFTPDSLRMVSPLESETSDWAVEWDVGDERMHTRERWYNLEQQTAVFWREGRLLVVTAAEVPPQLETATSPNGALALGRITDLKLFTTPGERDAQGVFRASLEVDSGAYMASIELVGDSVVGRARLGAPAPKLYGEFGVSDLALVDSRFESDQLPLTRALRSSTTFASGAKAGIYFEVYGATSGEQLDLALSAGSIEKPGVLNRALRFLRLKAHPSSPLIAWQERVTEVGRPFRRFVVMDLRALPQGNHQLTLTVRRPDGTRATAVRSVRVRR